MRVSAAIMKQKEKEKKYAKEKNTFFMEIICCGRIDFGSVSVFCHFCFTVCFVEIDKLCNAAEIGHLRRK